MKYKIISFKSYPCTNQENQTGKADSNKEAADI